MNILLSGANGFIGKNFVKFFEYKGFNLFNIGRCSIKKK